jgi:ABC-2 type transport system permease protein
MQILNAMVLSLNTYYQAQDLEVLFISPVDRTSLFFSRLCETHIKSSWMLIVFGLPLIVSSGLIYHASLFYHVYALLLFAAYSTIPVNLGIGLAILLSTIFYIRKLKKFLFSTGIAAVVSLVVMLRMLKPEQYVNPELFANLTLFIAAMKAPSFILLPNRWLSDAMFSFLSKDFTGTALICVFLLFLTSYMTTVFLLVLYKKFHYKGWKLLQEAGTSLKKRRQKVTLLTIITGGTAKILGIERNPLIKKDLLYQVRDVKNIHQILILLSLIVIYLFSIMSLPLNWEYYAVELRYIISFFNLGLILIIIASLCSRLVYPQIVSEGFSFWIIKTSPLTPKKYVRTKFLFFLVPIIAIGQFLIITSSFFIGVERVFILSNMLTLALTSFSFISMSIAFGIHDMKAASTDMPGDRMKTGNIAHMLVSIFLVILILFLEIVPVFLYFLREAQHGAFSRNAWFIIGGVTGVVILVNLVITLVSIHLSIRKAANLQLA